jgi:hypothetical protein
VGKITTRSIRAYPSLASVAIGTRRVFDRIQFGIDGDVQHRSFRAAKEDTLCRAVGLILWSWWDGT